MSKTNEIEILKESNRGCRYIDNLLCINNDNLMEKFKTQIYHPELSLIPDDGNDQEIPYLDINIIILNYIIPTYLFDKRYIQIFLLLIFLFFPVTSVLKIHMKFLLEN